MLFHKLFCAQYLFINMIYVKQVSLTDMCNVKTLAS